MVFPDPVPISPQHTNSKNLNHHNSFLDFSRKFFMSANGLSGVHREDGSTARMEDTELHVSIEDYWHKILEIGHLMMEVEPLDCLHPFQDFVSSIWFYDFETRFSPAERKNIIITKRNFRILFGSNWTRYLLVLGDSFHVYLNLRRLANMRSKSKIRMQQKCFNIKVLKTKK